MDNDPGQFFMERFEELLQVIICNHKLHISSVLPDLYMLLAKLKLMGTKNKILPTNIVQGFHSLVKFIYKNEERIQCDVVPQDVYYSTIASSIVLYILSDIFEEVYDESLMDHLVLSFRQLFRYSKDSLAYAKGCSNSKTIDQKQVLLTILSLLTDLTTVRTFPEIIIHKISFIGLYSLELANYDFIVSGIKLLTAVFNRHEKLQLSLLNDIEHYAVKFTNSERGNNYCVELLGESISVFSALILNLLQNTSSIPDEIYLSSSSDVLTERCVKKLETFVKIRHKKILLYAWRITSIFLEKCVRTDSDTTYSRAFNVFLNDLLKVVMKPEWPAAVLLLTYTAKHLANALMGNDMSWSLRIQYLDWLCKILVKLRVCAFGYRDKREKLCEIILRVNETNPTILRKEFVTSNNVTETILRQCVNIILSKYVYSATNGLDYMKSVVDYYMTGWTFELFNRNDRSKMQYAQEESSNSRNPECGNLRDLENKEKIPPSSRNKKKKDSRNRKRKTNITKYDDSFISDISALFTMNSNSVSLNPGEVELLMSFLMSKEVINEHFDVYLNYILQSTEKSQPRVRAKIMQTIKILIDVDFSLAGHPLIQKAMGYFIYDRAICVREVSADIIGSWLLHDPDRCHHYYEILVKRLLDKGVSVKRRVLNILGDLVIRYPEFPSSSQIYHMILLRINDEALVSMVLNFFIRAWFTPLPHYSSDSTVLKNRIKMISAVLNVPGVDTVALKTLLKEILSLKDKEPVTACCQLIDCFVNNILELEKNMSMNELSSSLQILYLFSSVKPEMLSEYICVLEPYLSLHFQEDENILIYVTGILTHVTPLLRNHSQEFLTQLETDLIKLMFRHTQNVVKSCIPCLAAIIKTVTHNSQLIVDCFNKFFVTVKFIAENPSSTIIPDTLVQRAVFIVGLLVEYFDDYISRSLQDGTIKEVFSMFITLMKLPKPSLHWHILRALGAVCCRYPNYLLDNELEHVYNEIVHSNEVKMNLKYQVVDNIRMFLTLEVPEYENNSKTDKINLMEMDDNEPHFGNAIRVTKKHMNLVLFCSEMEDSKLRDLSLQIFKLIIQDGLIAPHKIIPHLIALTTDLNHEISLSAFQMLNDTNVAHPGILHMGMKMGIQLSFELQKSLQKTTFVRGFEGITSPMALLRHIYGIVQRDVRGRKYFLRLLLWEYEETNEDLIKSLYLSDTLAYLPYELQDELLFIIHSIDILAATTGFNYVKDFEGLLHKPKTNIVRENTPNCDSDYKCDDCDSDVNEDELQEMLLERLPEDTTPLQECVFSFQNCLLILRVKKFLQQTYKISDRNVVRYSSNLKVQEDNTQINIANVSNYLSSNDLKMLESIKMKKPLDKDSIIKQYIELKNLLFPEVSDLEKAVVSLRSITLQNQSKKRKAVTPRRESCRLKNKKNYAKKIKKLNMKESDTDSD